MKSSLQTQIKYASIFVLSLIFAGAVFFSQRLLSSSVSQFEQTQALWLRVYSQSIVDDLMLGRIAAVSKKINFLVRQGFFQKIRIQSGALNLESKDLESTTAEGWLSSLLFRKDEFLVEVDLLSDDRSKWGTIRAEITPVIIFRNAVNDIAVFLISALGLMLFIVGLISIATDKLIAPIVRLTSRVRQKLHKDLPATPNEVEQLELALDAYEAEILSYKDIVEKQARLTSLVEVASQVSHDIRSPLSALSIITGTLTQISEEKRIIIRSAVNRINDVANALLQRGREVKIDDSSDGVIEISGLEENKKFQTSEISSELLSPLVDSIVSEKRIQYRHLQSIEIEADLSLGYAVFAKVNGIELKRAISNLVNNSVEAISDQVGRVTISVQADRDVAVITVQDNGKGIPANILGKIGEMGVSFGKESSHSGSGLGLYHAKRTAEEAGGRLEIDSIEGRGTKISLLFPKANVPAWFVEKLVVSSNMKVISLDDDISIHQIWRQRFEAEEFREHNICLRSFTSGPELIKWVRSEEGSSRSAPTRLFLIDFELINQGQTGLDLIEEMGLVGQAIVVTSRYEEEAIRSRCETLGIKIIPKPMTGFVPIEVAGEGVSS